MKSVRWSGGISSCSASSSVIWREGRRSSDSILKIRETEQPTRRASSCWVRSSVLRRCRTQVPNELSISANCNGRYPILKLKFDGFLSVFPWMTEGLTHVHRHRSPQRRELYVEVDRRIFQIKSRFASKHLLPQLHISSAWKSAGTHAPGLQTIYAGTACLQLLFVHPRVA